MEFQQQQDRDKQQPNIFDTGYIPQGDERLGNLWGEHLDPSEIINYIEMMLKGYELNDSGRWSPSMIEVYDEVGQSHEIKEGPLMSITEIRIIMTWLRSHLNSNTFLSKLSQEQINNIMFEVVWTMQKVFYKLRYKLPPQVRGMLSNTLENAIFIGLNRAGEGKRGMTLDAVSASHHSVEHIQGQNKEQDNPKDKQFKFFGW